MFAIIWIVVWAFIFGVFDDPSTGQVIGFILVGIGGPLGRWLLQALKD